MLDIKFLKSNLDYFRSGLAKRGLENQLGFILENDEKVRELQTELQGLQQERNAIAKSMGAIKDEAERAALKQKGEQIKNAIKDKEDVLKEFEEKLHEILTQLPNIPHESVPLGKDENDNKEIRVWGEIPLFEFSPKEHFDIEGVKKYMDFETAAKVSGSRFVYLKNHVAELHRALKNFMLDTLTAEFGYEEFDTPCLVNSNAVFGTGQLPKSKDDMFHTLDGKWLISTSEITLTNYVQDQILNLGDKPLRFTAASPCFRLEAGAAGKDTRGMIRNHQFTKVEMVSICKPEQSNDEHERMTACAEHILQQLGLPYRVMLLCTGDMGFCSQKTYDLEVWLPGQGKYREISSCSNCGDFQARRMKTRFKTDGKNELVHTLNGSGLAVGRTLIAVLENYQTADGNIRIPSILLPYMRGKSMLF